MANELVILQLGQYANFGVNWKNNMEEPMDPVGGPTVTSWTSDREVVLTCENSPENPGLASCRAIKLGDAVLTGTAPFDTPFGIQNGTTTQPVTVVDVVTPRGDVVVSYGAIVPLNIDKP